MQFLGYVSWRLLKAAALLVAVISLNFLLIRMVPGDPATVIAGESGMADADFVARIREIYGLDQPLLVQLKTYLVNTLSLDFGHSYRLQTDVLALIIERLPATIALTGAAFIFSLVVGVSLGVIAGSRPGSKVDVAIQFVSVALYSVPVFWIGLMLILVFSLKLHWLPASGTGFEYGQIPGVLEFLSHLLLPMITLSLFYIAVYIRLARTSVVDVTHQDFVRTAKSKGLPSAFILRKHVLPNAILPVVTMAALQAGHLVSGSIAVETIFAWPGIGRLGYEALVQRDYNMLLGVFLVTATMVVLLNLVADVLYVVVDPRIELVR
ncbi:MULTISPECIES: ABC transporter permease [Chelativorans]|jgi:peptide/nickel transport system permease protein|uniref:Binding-protein-dependent transport systems inner membrane component n=1 Tax=Chelativorans sp. (strain BNC1) TaxID=266779 RepID=Q11KW1_CHESB|nr:MULTISPECIES: ABC transporter permease [Chelativorans]